LRFLVLAAFFLLSGTGTLKSIIWVPKGRKNVTDRVQGGTSIQVYMPEKQGLDALIQLIIAGVEQSGGSSVFFWFCGWLSTATVETTLDMVGLFLFGGLDYEKCEK